MGTFAGDKWKARLEEDEDKELIDRISDLPDAVLGDIVTLLPTRDGARTQVLSSRWRRIWRSAPLNFDSNMDNPCTLRGNICDSEISLILSAHQGPGRRFRHVFVKLSSTTGDMLRAKLDRWLLYPTLDNLQELEFHYGFPNDLPLPESMRRFSSTLRVASFGGCAFPEGNTSVPLHLPVLKQLSLWDSTISESSLHALLAGCPVLQSLLLSCNSGCSRVRIVSRTVRSIGVCQGRWADYRLQLLILVDAPSLERLLLFSKKNNMALDISVISAPKLEILGPLSDDFSVVEFGSTVFVGPNVSVATVVPSVKILALVNEHLSMDMVIGSLQCFPCLEKLYIKTTLVGRNKDSWSDEYKNLVSALDIRVKKVVLLNYRGNKSHVRFAKLFVLNAPVLESMVLELEEGIVPSTEWIEKQHKRLHTKNMACRGAQIDFVGHNVRSGRFDYEIEAEVERVIRLQVHDLSTADPFVRFRDWPC